MMNRRDIVTVDLATRRKRVLTADDGHRRRVAASTRRTAAALVVPCVRHQARVQRPGASHAARARTRHASRALAPQLDRAADARRMERPIRGALLFMVEDRGRVGLWRLPLAAAPRRDLSVAGRRHDRRLRADRATAAVLAFERATRDAPAGAVRVPRRRLRRARDRDDESRAARAPCARRRARSHGQGLGRRARADVVIYPPNFDPTKKWPLLHSIHGGPHAAHQRQLALPLEHAGVRRPRLRRRARSTITARRASGRSGWRRSPARYGEKEFADVEAGTDWLLRQGYIDRTRLVATGGSYGGYMVAYMNGHTDRYKAYVCHAGCYDWVSMMATDGYQFFADELGAFHWDDPPRVMRQSPHHYVKRAKTPTLVIHGELDYRVPATQALQYYDTLKAKSVPARLVYFPDENHWILKPQNSRLWYREFFAWIEKYAKAGPIRPASK